MQSERSIYVIKPDGRPFADAIRRHIVASGLALVEVRAVVLSVEILAVLYRPVCSDELWRVVLECCEGAVCEAGIVEGEDAVRRLLALCGENTDPAKCAPGTIRRSFASGRSVVVGSRCYWENVIHRPKPNEVERDMRLLLPHLF